jgi:hypothetical protein
MTAQGWDRAFDEPIPLPDGRELTMLRQAGAYITKLPKAEHEKDHWQLAMRLLIDAATRGGILMLAEIAMRRALGHGKPKPPEEPRRKRTKKYRVVR